MYPIDRLDEEQYAFDADRLAARFARLESQNGEKTSEPETMDDVQDSQVDVRKSLRNHLAKKAAK